MRLSWPTRGDVGIAALYFAAAAVMLETTRFNGGVAIIWIATAILVPILVQRRRREWGGLLLLCGLASALATGLVGLGWKAALPLAAANMIEAYVGAFLLIGRRASRTPLGSLRWMRDFIISVGVAAPLAASLFAASTAALLGLPISPTLTDFFIGHALGALTFIPLFSMLVTGQLKRRFKDMDRAEWIDLALVLGAVAATVAIVFSIERYPLLFLPAGPAIVAIFRGREFGAAMSIVLLAVIGGSLTLAGQGPIVLIGSSVAERVQFFQFYLAAAVLLVLPVAADLRNRSRLHRELRLSEERYRLLADHSTDVVMHTDVGGKVRFISPSVTQLGGYDPSEVLGRRPFFMIHPADHDLIRAEHARALANPGATRIFEYRGLTRSGEARWFESHTRSISDRNGRPDGVFSLIRDISDRKAVEERLAEAASTDPLTGLANRRALSEAAARLLADERVKSLSLALIDLDHFKSINDRFGHEVGDRALQHFAAIAKSLLRARDILARTGGEEFAILLPGLGPAAAEKVCERLRARIAAETFATGAHGISFTMSGGIAAIDQRGLDDAQRRADEALYRAKAGGRNRIAVAP